MRLFIILSMLILSFSGTINIALAEDNVNIKLEMVTDEEYTCIENCNIDIKNNDFDELTEYLKKEIDLGEYSIKFDKIIPADLEGNKYWLQYNIYNGLSKTPYNIWVCFENGILSYSNKWNKERLDFTLKDYESYTLNTFEFENMKNKFSNIIFDDSKLNYQRVYRNFSDSLIPCFVIMNSYRGTESSGYFALVMQYVCNKDIYDEYNNMCSYIDADRTIKYNFEKNNFTDIEKYLKGKLPAFKNYNFELGYVFPAITDTSFIDIGKKTYAKMIPQNSYLIYELKIGEYVTPYKIEVMIDKSGKTKYRYNFTEEDLKSVLENEFIKSIKIDNKEVKKAVLECENTASNYFYGEEYEKVSEKIVKGFDSELRPYIDTEILYEKTSFRNDDKVAVSQRHYVSLY